jgi:hypothetical protein
MKNKKIGTIKKECQTCCKEFISFLSDNKKFCNRKCFEKRRKPSMCKGCGIEFYVPGEPNMKYHNRECWVKHNSNLGYFYKGHEINQNKIHSEETKQKISLFHTGKKVLKETCDKMSQIAIKRISNHYAQKYGKWVPNFNYEACNIIEEYGKEHDYDFQHALKGGEYYIKELGYWVDGYDKEKNVVIEYYEKHHNKQIEKDKKRKERIMEILKCKFIIIYYDKNIETWE